METMDVRKIFLISAASGLLLGSVFWYWQNVWSKPGSTFWDAISIISDYSENMNVGGFSNPDIPESDFSKDFISREEFVSRVRENPLDELRKIGDR